MRKIYIILALTLLSIELSAETLSLEQCQQMALENNHAIRSADAKISQADYTVAQMKANFLPNFSAQTMLYGSNMGLDYSIDGGYLPTYTINTTTGEMDPNLLLSNGIPTMGSDGSYLFNQYAYFPGIDIELKMNYLFSASATIEQPIYMGGKVRAAYKMAQSGRELAELNRELTLEEVLLESDRAYWNCVRAEAMIEALEEYKATLDSFYRDVENAVDVGMKSSNDMLKVQVQVNDAELNLMKARNAKRLAIMNLCHVIGLPLTSDIELADFGRPIESIAYEGYSVEDRIEYNMLTKQIEISEQNERVVRADYIPNIAAVGMVGYSNGLELNGETLFNGGNYGGLISLSVPIFHWGEGRNKVRAERIKSDLLRIERDNIAEKMELEIAQAYNSMLETELEYRFVGRALAQAEENMRVTKNGYDVGSETLSSLLEAQAMWSKALTDVVDAEARLRIAQTLYLKSTRKACLADLNR